MVFWMGSAGTEMLVTQEFHRRSAQNTRRFVPNRGFAKTGTDG